MATAGEKAETSAEPVENVDGSSKVYHERQRLQFCLLHSLNNLLQEKDSFTRADLDAIADNLALNDPKKDFWTPLSLVFKSHHNAITGNYDVNVLIVALERKKKRVLWHDHRNGASSIDLDGQSLVGLVLNVSVRKYRGLWTSRHWIALKKVDGFWFNLDSDLPSPEKFEDKKEVIAFLDCIMSRGGELLIVLDDGS